MVSYYERQNSDPFHMRDEEDTLSLAVVKVETMRALGVPLMNAIIDVRSRSSEGKHPARNEEDARNLSSLVKTSMSLVRHISSRFSVNNPNKLLAIRIGLTGFVGSIVSDHYKTFAVLPDEEALFELLNKVDVVLSRLDLNKWVQNLEVNDWRAAYHRSDSLFSSGQLEAGGVLIQAISKFNFGFENEALLTYIMDELSGRVSRIVERLSFSNEALWQRDMLELTLVKTLSTLYYECHMEEIARLNSLTEEAQQEYITQYNGSYSLDPIWQAFDMRVHMLQVLADHLDLKNKQQWAEVA